MSAREVDGDWSVASYPVRCDVHKSPIPPGQQFRTERPAPNSRGPQPVRRVCLACDLLGSVIGQPITDPRKRT